MTTADFPAQNGGLRLGTRRSPLALAQSGMMARALEARWPGLSVELVPIITTGDVVPGDLSKVGGKGLFTQELETGLLDGSLDLAVHSMKDLPVRLPEGLVVAAHPERADPRDVLVSEVATRVAELPRGARVLTGSLRRRAQLLARRPDLAVEPLRGNVETRLRKWRQSGAEAVVLAAAGLSRLGLGAGDVPAHPLEAEEMLPAPGQGILAVQVRRGGAAEPVCAALDHPPSRTAARAERAVVAAFGGDCTLPLAAWARPAGPRELGGLRLAALLASPDGLDVARAEVAAEPGEEPETLADRCVARLREAGAERLMATLRSGRAG
jgi:hydroxymethylbilane synthase